MPSQKLPLFGGIIAPVHNGNLDAGSPIAAIPLFVAAPPDKALEPRGIQATYEVHLWIRPSNIDYGGVSSEQYTLVAYLDSDPTNYRTIWAGRAINFGDLLYSPPIKILDGYPIRGNVNLALVANVDNAAGADAYPVGIQAWGYIYRVGKGIEVQAERRFIGEASPDDITSGMPIQLDPGDKVVLHTFEQNRIDEISLAISSGVDAAALPPLAPALTFEDVNNNPIIPGHQVVLGIYPSSFNSFKDPQSVYYINQVPFGGGYLPNLDHISIELGGAAAGPVHVHGYFTRR